MSHQCPFPVRATDTRRCYRTGSVPGFTLSLTLVAILSGYAGLADAAPAVKEIPCTSGEVVGWAKGRLLAAPRAGLSEKELAKALKQVRTPSPRVVSPRTTSTSSNCRPASTKSRPCRS
jgi:thermitase